MTCVVFRSRFKVNLWKIQHHTVICTPIRPQRITGELLLTVKLVRACIFILLCCVYYVIFANINYSYLWLPVYRVSVLSCMLHHGPGGTIFHPTVYKHWLKTTVSKQYAETKIIQKLTSKNTVPALTTPACCFWMDWIATGYAVCTCNRVSTLCSCVVLCAISFFFSNIR